MSKRKNIMLAYPFEERRLIEPKFNWTFPVIVQPKLDGDRCRALIYNNNVILLSSEENEIRHLSHINKELNSLFPDSVREFDGELYNHQISHNIIHSAVSRKVNEAEHSLEIEYHIFDLVSSKPQFERSRALANLLPEDGIFIKRVPFRIAENLDQVYSFYKEYIDLGYEGIILRDFNLLYTRKRTTKMLKFKPKKYDFYVIKNVIEAIDRSGIPKGMIGAFECESETGDTFKVGAGMLSHQERVIKWEEYLHNPESLKGKNLMVQYQRISERGAPLMGLCFSLTSP